MSDIRYSLMNKVKKENIPTDLNMFDLYDPLSIDWSKFNFTGHELEYSLSDEDIKRPDLLSYKIYGTVIYQDILFLINNIGDILNTPTLTQIKIPDVDALKNFIALNKKTQA